MQRQVGQAAAIPVALRELVELAPAVGRAGTRRDVVHQPEVPSAPPSKSSIDDFHYIDRVVQVEAAKQIKEAAAAGIRIVTASVPYRAAPMT